MSKYTLECYTPNTAYDGDWAAENCYDAETPEECARIIHNCTRRIAGIRKVVVWINETDEREPLPTETPA